MTSNELSKVFNEVYKDIIAAWSKELHDILVEVNYDLVGGELTDGQLSRVHRESIRMARVLAEESDLDCGISKAILCKVASDVQTAIVSYYSHVCIDYVIGLKTIQRLKDTNADQEEIDKEFVNRQRCLKNESFSWLSTKLSREDLDGCCSDGILGETRKVLAAVAVTFSDRIGVPF